MSNVIDGDVVLSAGDAARAIQQLTARAETLDRLIDAERSMAQEPVVAAIPGVLRYLRMHGVLLLNISDEHADELSRRVTDPAVVAALAEAWNLADAPLPQPVIEQIRAAAQDGNCRW